MMFLWLLIALASAVVLCYVPFGERTLRKISLGMSLIAGILGGYVVRDTWMSSAPFGYADMWLASPSTATVLVLVLVSAFLMQVVAYQRLAHEHLEGPLSLSRLRLHLAAINGFTLAAVVTSMANNLWLAFLGVAVCVALLISATGITKKKTIGLALFTLLLAVTAVLVMRGSGLHWDNMTVSNALQQAVFNESMMRAAWGLSLLTLGALAGFAPFGSLFSRTVQPASMLLRAASRSTLAIVATATFLRLTFVTDVALNGAGWTGDVLLAVGVLSALWALGTMWHDHDNTNARFALLAACTAFVVGVGSAGVIVALMLLAARVTLAPLGAIVEQGSSAKLWRRPLVLGVLGLPLATCSTAYMIMIGYGIQLHPVLTVLMLFVLIAWSMRELARLPLAEATEEPRTFGIIEKTAMALIALQVGVMVMLLTTQTIGYAVVALDQFTTSL